MATALNQRSPVAKAGWLIGLFLVGWLAFLFLPLPRSPEPMRPIEVRSPSKLEQVGLRNYTDWEGLPEFFAIWADQAEWKDGRTRFAYWHPVMKTYSYYFEATRVDSGYRFREIAEPPTSDGGYYWDESLGEDCPIRFYRSPVLVESRPAPTLVKPALDAGKPENPQIKIQLEETKSAPPSPRTKP